MTDFTSKFEKISISPPQWRGLRFERLFYEIFEKDEILLEKSYRNEDGSQQIDGAVEINRRIFLVEVKWEESSTLAASKLYSFLGKINSKIEGTLGIFISYNELTENFIYSARAGIKQNCIIIHGEDNILPIIRGDVSISDYVWYLYQQASTRNRISIPISEFKSIPQTKSDSSDNNDWKILYDALVSEDTSGNFELVLNEKYDLIKNLPEKAIILYPILQKTKQVHSKIDYLFDTLISNYVEDLIIALINKLITSHWIRYADDYILNKLKVGIPLDSEKANKIADNVLPYLRDHYDQWEEENKASLVLDYVFNDLSEEYKIKVYCAYAVIYCDNSRKDHYPQKELANKIFSKLDAKERWDTIKDEVYEKMVQYKADESIFSDDTEEEIKKYVIHRIKRDFRRIIEESEIRRIEKHLEKIYDQI